MKLMLWLLKPAVVCLLYFSALALPAFQEPAEPSLPNLDRRREAASPGPRLDANQAAAAAQLKARVPGLQIDLDDLLGTPKRIASRSGFLSGPKGQGKGVSPKNAQAFPEDDPHRAVKAFLKEHAALFGHGPEVLPPARLKRDAVTPHNGMRTVVWEQTLDDLAVFGSQLTAHTTKAGELISVSSQFLPALEAAANAGVANRAAVENAPPVAVRQAIQLAAANLQEPLQPEEVLPLDVQPAGKEKRQRFKAGRLPGEARARLVWLPMQGALMRLAWEVHLTRRQGGETYRLLVDARTGEVLVRHCQTFYLGDATYRVFTNASPAPMSPGLSAPATNQAPLVPRSLVTLPAISTNASPIGWISDGDNETRGNNVDAHLDRNADDQPDLPRPQGAPFHVFDFPLDLAQSPQAYGDAAVVQLFYWCNWMHDTLYELGFTEAAGNFQKDNFGRGGLDNDALQADAQDGSGTDNANFTVIADGIAPRMQMYLFSGPQPNRDGDLDAEIILHEYTHGLSCELVGGGVGIYQNQTYALGEGWSDFYALALLSNPAGAFDGAYTEGGYSTYLFYGLTENYYFGIRRYPYSTDLSKNPLTFKDIDSAQIGPHAGVPLNPTTPFDPGLAGEPHRAGEVWCVTLWEARAKLIRKLGYAAGNQLILQLVTDGMKLSPPNPTFLQARDAILLADRVDTGGANQIELWSAFAKRGMGLSATEPPNWMFEGVREAFDLPDILEITPALPLIFSGPAGGSLTPPSRSFTLTNTTASPLAWSAWGAEPYLSLSTTGGTLQPGAAATIFVSPTGAANDLALGSHWVNLLFQNGSNGAVQGRSVELRVLDFAPMPFVEGFESGSLASFWSVSGSGLSRVDVTPNNAPHAGAYHLAFQSGAPGYYARNEATLGIDLAGYTNVVLRFWAREFKDEPDGPPASPFIDGADFDGVAISADGFQWYEAQGLRRLRDAYAEVVVDLDAAIARYGLNYNATFRIRFNQVGHQPIPTDGIVIDDISITGIAPRRFTVTLPAQAREGDGVLAGQGTVSLPFPAASDITVSLASSDTTEVTVPPTITLRAGATSAAFDLTIIDDALLDGAQAAMITAAAPGFISGRNSLLVQDNETAALALTVPAVVRETDGTLAGQGRLGVSLAPAVDIIVALTSSDPSEVQVPAAVVIPAGRTNATFDLTVVRDYQIDGTQSATITAHVPGWTDATGTITVLDAESTNLFVTVPFLLNEGNNTLVSAGSVRLAGTLPTNLVVTLASSRTNSLAVPAAVTIPAGQTYAYFSLNLLDDAQLTGPQFVTVTAGAPGFISGIAGLRLLDNEQPPAPYQPNPPHLSRSNLLSRDLSWALGVPELIVNGDFEAGILVGWMQENIGDGEIVSDDGTVDPPGAEGRTPPYAGRLSALFQQREPGRHTLFQEITLPVYMDSAVLNWTDRIRNHAADFAEDQSFRVEIRGWDDSVLATAFATQPGDPLLNDWTERSFDLSGFRGQTIRLAFVEMDSLGYLNVRLDNVRVMLGYSSLTTSEIYFGTNAVPGPAQFQGVTTNTTWDLPALALDTTYYWQIIARRGFIRTAGPIWQFSTRGLGPLDHFTWSPIPVDQSLSQPFQVTLTARDDIGNLLPGFSGSVALSAARELSGDRLQVLTFTAFANLNREYRKTLGAISTWFTNYAETSLAATDPDALETQLRSKDVLLVVEQESAPEGQMAELGAAWAPVLDNFVTNGGIVIVCSFTRDEHELLDASGLMQLTKLDAESAADLAQAADHPLLEGVALPFTGQSIATYASSNGLPVLQTVSSNAAVVLVRDVGAGQVVMIGTDFSDNHTSMNRVIANAVRLAQGRHAAPVGLTREFSGYFENGVWTGSLTVLGAGSNIVLRADDRAGHAGTSNPFNVSAPNDLSIDIADAPDPVPLGSNILYTVTVRNSGPDTAHQVRVTSPLPSEVTFVGASSSQGACTLADGVIDCELGDLPGPGAATLLIEVTPITAGRITATATVSTTDAEAFRDNNTASVVTRVDFPKISIADVSVTEGDSGTKSAVFTVQLWPPSSLPAGCAFATADLTATAGADYEATSGVIIFPPGATNQTLAVTIYGNTLYENPKVFNVNLSSPTNAVLANLQATGVIMNDDPMPALSIDDVTVTEGARGTTTNAVFAVRLSAASGVPVTVRYATTNGTAQGVFDYLPLAGILSFLPGITNQTITVTVKGDDQSESNETFLVKLSDVTGATLVRTQAVATIIDDDTGRLDHFTWSTVASPQSYNVPFAATVTAQDTLGNPSPGFAGPLIFSGFTDSRDIAIGAGSNSWEFPCGAYYHDERLQSIYLAGEIGEPVRITALSLELTQVPGQILENWTIRMKHTALSSYAASAWEDSDWTMVYQQPATLLATGWVTFQFTTPFEFNGSDNLLIDFSFNNNTFSSDGRCRFTPTTEARSIYFRTDSGYGDPLAWSGSEPPPLTINQVPTVKLAVETPVSISPQTAGNLVNGVWSGSLTAHEVASRLVLRAADGQGHFGISNPFTVTAANDLAVSITDVPDPVRVGDNLTYTLTLTNTGPASANGLVLSNALPSNTLFVSAGASQGVCAASNGVVRCDLGSLAAGATAAVTVVVTPTATGLLTNLATVGRGEADAFAGNNIAKAVTRVSPPGLSVNDVTVIEGTGGTTGAVFTVRLSGYSSDPVTVDYFTSDGTATNTLDYLSRTGTLVFPPGMTTQTVTIVVVGDTNNEPNETFYLNLTNAANAVLTKGQGIGTITDDDPLPSVSIGDVAVLEGNSGTTNIRFTLALSAASGKLLSVGYATTNGTAIAGSDYQSGSGTAQFPPGVVTRSLNFIGYGDKLIEPDETFYVNLTRPVNAVLGRAQGVCTIVNDDGLAGVLDHFDWDPIPSPQRVARSFPVTVTAKDFVGAPVTTFNGNVMLSGRLGGEDIAVGSGTGTWGFPMASDYHDVRTQVIYTSNELSGPRHLVGLALDMVVPPAQTLNHWTIRLKHTALSNYNLTAAWETSNWTTVYQADTTLLTNGWVVFPFTTPFDYNGTNHLVVDFSFNNSYYTVEGLCRCTTTAQNRSLYAQTDSGFGDPLNWGSGFYAPPAARMAVPNIRLLSGFPVAVAPGFSDSFTNGVWTGNLYVLQPATNLAVLADDGFGHTGPSPLFTVQPDPDSDNDGLPDDWELRYFGSLNAPNGGPNDDPDGDGLTNLEEYLAGTNPLDPASVLAITAIAVDAAAAHIIFPTILGHHYRVERADSLPAAWTPIADDLAGTGGLLEVTDPFAPDRPTRFYRVRLLP